MGVYCIICARKEGNIMILIPEQVSVLREKERMLKREFSGLKDYIDGKDNSISYSTHARNGRDYISDTSFGMCRTMLEEIKEALQTSVYLKSRKVDSIQIGTRFLFQFLGEEELCDFTLVDSMLGLMSMDGFISKDSPLGASLLNKKSGDVIENMGRVLEIKSEYADYLHYIKERPNSCRISSEQRNTRKNLIANCKTDEQSLKEYKKYQKITLSQKELLEQEQMRLMMGSLDDLTRQRLGHIKKILEEREVIVPEDKETIDIGSRFSIQTFGEDGIVTRRVEMINTAVGDELENEYVEAISPMGSKILGLKNNDEFIFRKGRSQYISGTVFDIDNSNDQVKTNNALTYQKTRSRRK